MLCIRACVDEQQLGLKAFECTNYTPIADAHEWMIGKIGTYHWTTPTQRWTGDATIVG